MKRIIYTIPFVLFCSKSFSQVAIGNSATSITAFGSLDLSNETRPLILPNIDSQPANAVEGTIIFDNSSKKIEYKNDTNWVVLTLNAGSRNTPLGILSSSPEPQGVIIGSNTTSAPGVLVLESSNLGLVLPRANAPQNISKPTSGSVIFDNSKNMVAVYNGLEWSFWEIPLVITKATLSATVGTSINQSISIPYSGGKATAYPAGNTTQNGVTITYPAGTLTSSGTIPVQLSGSPVSSGTIIFKINEGNQPTDIITITVS